MFLDVLAILVILGLPLNQIVALEQTAPWQREDPNLALVAAIDFGTTYSGYAFSFTTFPEGIRMNMPWKEAEIGSIDFDLKTPTFVLTGPDGNFEAFGYEAEERYSSLVEEDGIDDYSLFRDFKMILHDREGISMTSKVTATNGKTRLALDIFSMSLKYLKDHLYNRLQGQLVRRIDEDNLRWVITVPAIWSEEAKQFMRVAAERARLIDRKDSTALVIGLDSEVASQYSRTLSLDQFIETGRPSELSFDEGVKYLVVDCGGGKLDITAHEIVSNDKVKELIIADGGALGGINVDESFHQLMQEIFGADFIQFFKSEMPQECLKLMSTFEEVKTSFNEWAPFNGGALRISLGNAVATEYLQLKGQSIENAIANSQKPGISFENGKLVLEYETAKSLFDPTVNKIVELVKSQMQMPSLTALSYVLLVGGFGESPYLQKQLRKELNEGVSLLVPSAAQMTIMKGSVLYGHYPNRVTSRIARLTYGISSWVRFDQDKHDSQKKVRCPSHDWCTQVFKPIVIKGSSVDVGQTFKERRRPNDPTQRRMKIYSVDRSELADVEYIDSPDVTLVGVAVVEIPYIEQGMNREVEVEVVLGGTEIQVFATDLSSGKRSQCVVNFL